MIEELKSHDAGAHEMGGSMRLGAVRDLVMKGTLLHKIYQSDHIEERHRHRYEVNPRYVEQFEQAGLVVSARSERETS